MDPSIVKLLEDDDDEVYFLSIKQTNICSLSLNWGLTFNITVFSCTQDETMHSGADVQAFQAALNRDIGGGGAAGDASSSVLSRSDAAGMVSINFYIMIIIIIYEARTLLGLDASLCRQASVSDTDTYNTITLNYVIFFKLLVSKCLCCVGVCAS
jgi:hypothetical protein